jgi:hypothetical protein
LANWVLALPLLLWLLLVSMGAAAAAVVAWFAILLTGRMPGRLGDYLVGVLRYGWRVSAFLFGLTDRYPGFRVVAGYVDLADQPAVLYSAQPLDRNRLTVLFRLALLVPALLFVLPAVIVLVTWLVVAWWCVLVVGRWPDVLRRNVAGCFRYLLRFAGYAWLIVDVFPPVIPDPEPLTVGDAATFVRIRPDPREVTGPPWPRLVGGEAYQPPGLLRWPITIGVVAVGIASVAVAGLPTGQTGPSPSEHATAPPPTSSPAVSSTAPAPSPTQVSGTGPSAGQGVLADLQRRLLPPPPGYGVDEVLGYPDAPPAVFEQPADVGSTPVGYLGGYEGDYSPASSALLLEIVLLRFSSPQDAARFEMSASVIPQGQSPQRSAFAAIPGAIAVDGTSPSPTCCDHAVAARKGSVLMLVDDSTQGPGPAPADLAAWAEQQYARLQ